jgi:hypothetical protein
VRPEFDNAVEMR